MKEKGITQVHGAPNHPQTQGKIERYHRTMKNVVKLEYYYSLSDLKKAIDEFIAYYNNERYHESLENCTPASVYFGTNHKILKKRQHLKQKSMKQRRINHMIHETKKSRTLLLVKSPTCLKTYSDYMMLPPLEKRVSNHLFKAF